MSGYGSAFILLSESAREDKLPGIARELAAAIGMGPLDVVAGEDYGVPHVKIGFPFEQGSSILPALRGVISHKYTHLGAHSTRTRKDLAGNHAATHVRITIGDDDNTMLTVPDADPRIFRQVEGVVGATIVPRLPKNPGAIGGSEMFPGYILVALDADAGRPDEQLGERGLAVGRAVAEIAGVFMYGFQADRPLVQEDPPLEIVGAYGTGVFS